MMDWQIGIAILVVYLLITLYIGYRSQKAGANTFIDHTVADRSFGIVVLTFTFAATFHSAYAFTGIVGFAGVNGIPFWINGLWLVPPAFLFWQVGKRLWVLGQKYHYVTLGHYLGDVYGSRSVAGLVAIVQALFTVPYVTVQLAGSGFIFETLTGGRIPFEAGAAILLVLMVAYVWVGGIRAVAWTDTLQGVMMFIAVFFGSWWVVQQLAGSATNLFQQAAAETPEAFSMPGTAGALDAAGWVSLWLPIAIGIVLAPQIVIRVFAARSLHVLKWSAIGGAIYLTLIYTFTPAVGLAWPLYGEGIPADQFFVAMLWEQTPVLLGALALAGGLAAAMSTADSQIHAVSATVTKDLYGSFKPRSSDRELRRVAHGTDMLLGALAYVFLITQPGLLIDIVTISIAGTALLAPALVVALYTRRPSAHAAVASIASGTLVLVVLQFLWVPPVDIVFSPAMWALLTSTVVMTVSTLLKRPATQGSLVGRQQDYVTKVFEAAQESHA